MELLKLSEKERSMKSLTLSNMDRIWPYGFHNLRLEFISLPNVRSIGEGAFENSKLDSLALPNCTYIGKGAFVRSSFTFLFLLEIRTIGDHAFNLVNSPDTKVTLPKKFNTPEELDRIFVGPVDKVRFT